MITKILIITFLAIVITLILIFNIRLKGLEKEILEANRKMLRDKNKSKALLNYLNLKLFEYSLNHFCVVTKDEWSKHIHAVIVAENISIYGSELCSWHWEARLQAWTNIKHDRMNAKDIDKVK